MADVTIDGTISTSTARGMRSVAFVSALVGYFFYIESGTGAFVYEKTTDGGATWGAAVTIKSAASQVAYDVWFDQWTPGDSGTKIHLWYFDVTNDDVFYRSLDTSGDTLGTERTVFNGATSIAGRGCFVSGTKTRSGYLYCAYDIDAGTEKGLHRSTDGGTTWSASLSTTFVEATIDQCLLFPATGTGDNNDCWAVYQDASTDELTVKTWDSSAGSATESAAMTGGQPENTTDLVGQYGFAASVRHSDGNLVIAYFDDFDVAGFSGFHVVTWNGSALTNKTLIQDLSDDYWYPQVFIDQLTDNIYVAYNGKRDGSQTLGTATTVNYVKSTDGGSTWSAETSYMQSAAGAVVQVWAPLMGPRFYVGWRVGTTLIGNAVNSVTFGAGAVTLVVADATMGLGVESPALIQANVISVNDALLALSVESPLLVQANILAVIDALVALSAENVVLSSAIQLVLQDAAIALVVDSPALVQASMIAVQDATMQLSVESPLLVQASIIAVQDSLILLSVESPILTQANIISIQDGLISLAPENVVLELGGALVVADSLMNLSIEVPALIQASTCVAANSITGLSVTSPILFVIGLPDDLFTDINGDSTIFTDIVGTNTAFTDRSGSAVDFSDIGPSIPLFTDVA